MDYVPVYEEAVQNVATGPTVTISPEKQQLIGVETALGFVFDPRYRDFPFASLTMAAVPFSLLTLLNRPQQGVRPIAEAVFAALLAMAALYTIFNEGSNNWQALWTCAIYFLLAVTLWQARAAQNPE